MKSILIEPHFLPGIEYFCCVTHAKRIILETSEHFVKQSYRTRYTVNSAAGPITLVVPVTRTGKVPYRQVRIDYSQKWQNRHWRSIVTSYRNAPYFDHYADLLHNPIFQRWESLCELSVTLLTICLKSMGLSIPLEETSEYHKSSNNDPTDLRHVIDARAPWNARNLYRPVPYLQVFGSSFVENLSVLDLLFCAGPDALRIIRDSACSNQ